MKDTIIFACKEPTTIGRIIGKIVSKGGGETKDEIKAQVKVLVESGDLIKSGARRGTRYQADPEIWKTNLSGIIKDSFRKEKESAEIAEQIDSEDPVDELIPQEDQVDEAPIPLKQIDEPETVVEVYDRVTGFIAREDRLYAWVDTWKFVCICAQELSLHPFDVVENLPRLVSEDQVEARWTQFSNQYRVRRQADQVV